MNIYLIRNKMKLLLQVFITLAVFFTFSLTALSEDPDPSFFIGAYAGYNINNHDLGFTNIEGSKNPLPATDKGVGNGMSFGGLFEINLGKQFSIDTRLGFSILNARSEMNENIDSTQVKDINPPFTVRTEQVTVYHFMDSKIQMAALEPVLAWKFFDGFKLSAGFRLGYLLTASFDNSDKIVRPENVTYLGGSTKRFEENDIEIPNKNSLQIQLESGLAYSMEISKSTFLTTGIRYYYPLTSLSKDVDWHVSNFQAALSLALPIFPPPVVSYDTLYKRDTTDEYVIGLNSETIVMTNTNRKLALEELDHEKIYWTVIYESYLRSIPRLAELACEIKALGIQADGAYTDNPVITVREVEFITETIPLLPYIFFMENNSELSESGIHTITPDQISNFDDENLQPKTLIVYYELLNIIGYRMKKFPNSNLRIIGCNNNLGPEKRNIKLSKSRAENVALYLHEVWGIDRKRLKTESRNLPKIPANNKVVDGQKENQRVEFYSDNENILSHIKIKSFTTELINPDILLLSTVDSEAGIKDWSAEISFNNNKLKEFNGTGQIPEKLSWSLDNSSIPEISGDAIAKLSVTDNTGQEQTSSAYFRVERDKIFEEGQYAPGRTITEKYYIIAHYAKSDLISNQTPFLNFVKSRINEKSKVTISGYADRTGTEQINHELANQRVDEVQNYLEIADDKLIKEPIGSTILLYDNDLPEGRCYSRTIRITISNEVE